MVVVGAAVVGGGTVVVGAGVVDVVGLGAGACATGAWVVGASVAGGGVVVVVVGAGGSVGGGTGTGGVGATLPCSTATTAAAATIAGLISSVRPRGVP